MGEELACPALRVQGVSVAIAVFLALLQRGRRGNMLLEG